MSRVDICYLFRGVEAGRRRVASGRRRDGGAHAAERRRRIHAPGRGTHVPALVATVPECTRASLHPFGSERRDRLRQTPGRVLEQRGAGGSALGRPGLRGLDRRRLTVVHEPACHDSTPSVSPTVELYPSGHRFETESGEPVLEAALRAGRSPAFGCANGSRGECRARIVAGEVDPVRFHDYFLTDAEKRAEFALLCSVAPRGDLVVESAEASGVDDIAPQRVRARVTRVETASADHAVVHLKVQRARVMRYLSGQRATVRFEPAPAARTRSSRGAAEDRFANGGRHASRRSSSASAQNCRYPFSTSTRNRGRSGWWVWSTTRPAPPARDRRDGGPRPGTCLEQRERRHGGIGGIPTGNCLAPPVPANAGCRPRDAIRRSRIGWLHPGSFGVLTSTRCARPHALTPTIGSS